MMIYLVFEGDRYEGESVDSAFLQQEDAERRVALLEAAKETRLDPYYYFHEQWVQ